MENEEEGTLLGESKFDAAGGAGSCPGAGTLTVEVAGEVGEPETASVVVVCPAAGAEAAFAAP
jgi:hypothetical protein